MKRLKKKSKKLSYANAVGGTRKTGNITRTCADEFTADLSQALKPEKNKERNHDSPQIEKGYRSFLGIFSQSTLAIFREWFSLFEPGM